MDIFYFEIPKNLKNTSIKKQKKIKLPDGRLCLKVLGGYHKGKREKLIIWPTIFKNCLPTAHEIYGGKPVDISFKSSSI